MKTPVKKDFIHLHNYSEYSLPDGMSSIRKMIEKAKKLGMKYLAITDNGTMFGALYIYRVLLNSLGLCKLRKRE